MKVALYLIHQRHLPVTASLGNLSSMFFDMFSQKDNLIFWGSLQSVQNMALVLNFLGFFIFVSILQDVGKKFTLVVDVPFLSTLNSGLQSL